MSLITLLMNFLKISATKETVDNNYPNGWGRDEYNGHFYARIKQENLDVNSIQSNVGWVQAYANKHLSGISLKRTGNGEALVC